MKGKYLRFAFLGWLSGMAGGLLLMTPQAWIASSGGDIWLIGMLSIWSLPYAMKPVLAIFLDALRSKYAWSYSELVNGLIVLLAILIVLLGGVNPVSQKTHFSLLLSMGCALASMLDTCIDGARIQLDKPGEQEMVAGYYTSGYRVGIIGASGLGLVLAKYYGWLLLYQGAGAVMFTGWWLVEITLGREDVESSKHALGKWSIQEVKSWITQKSIQLVLGVVILVKLHDVFVESMLQSYLINHLHLEVDTVGILCFLK